MFSLYATLRCVMHARTRIPAGRRRCSGLRWNCLAIVLASSSFLPPAGALAQTASTAQLDTLIAQAEANNPAIRAARARVVAAEARIDPSGLRADPMLMLGLQNVPVSAPGFRDEMTMKMVGVAQTIPYPGKLSLTRRVAQNELIAARAALDDSRLAVTASVQSAYYDLAYLERAFEITDRNQRLLLSFMKVAEARYGVGTGAQNDVLRLRIEATRLSEEAVILVEQRRVALAELNALLDRPSESPVTLPTIPQRVARAAVAHSISMIRFASAALGARVADSPLPPLDTLQALAEQRNPLLRREVAMLAAQTARLELARREHLPDFDVGLSYGQRNGLSDMFTATLSLPIALQKGRKQDQAVAEARATLLALEADRHQQRNAVRADVARLHSELERSRSQLALYVKAILPQGRALLTSATAGYQVGRADFLTLLETQATLFTYETTYFRILSEFARTLAELERVVGEEIVR